MAKRAEARYVISADDQTSRGTQSAERNFGRLRSSLGGFRTFALAAGAAAVSAIVGIANAAEESSIRLAELARRGRDFELSPELTRGLQFAGTRAGVEGDEIFQAFSDIQRATDEAAEGNKGLIETFKSLNIEVESLTRASRLERFITVLEALRAARRAGQDISREQTELLGGEGGELGRLVAGGGRGIVQSLELFRQLSAPIDRVASIAEENRRATAEFDLAFGTLWDMLLDQWNAFETTGLRRGAEFIGAINRFYRRLEDQFEVEANEEELMRRQRAFFERAQGGAGGLRVDEGNRVQSRQLEALESIDRGIREIDTRAKWG